jgi:hypothetical protein
MKTKTEFLKSLFAKSWIAGVTTCGLLQFQLAAENASQTPSSSSVQVNPNGSKIIQDEDGASIEIQPDGTKIIKKQDGSVIQIKPDGSKFIQDRDGTTIEIRPDGTKIIKKPANKL